MTQDIIVWALLAGLVGLIWVMAIAVLGQDHYTRDNRQGNASPELRDGYAPHEQSSRPSRVAA